MTNPYVLCATSSSSNSQSSYHLLCSNAGVVAAGEAQIESTVTGNTASLNAEDGSSALSDQSQIYLQINNALTEVG